MNINAIIRNRRSVYPRNFDPDKKIENEVIEKILDNAIWAPTHKLTQPWRFVVYHGKGIKSFFEKQAEIYLKITPDEKINKQKLVKFSDKVILVSHIIAVIAEHDPKERIPKVEEIVGTSCALQNIYLSLEYYGICGYLSTGDVCYTGEMASFLNLNPGEEVLGFFQLGIPKDKLPVNERKRFPAKDKTIWVSG